MITKEEYQKYIGSEATQKIIQWIVDTKKQEKADEEIVPPGVQMAISCRDFILNVVSFQDGLRSSNCLNISLKEWQEKEEHGENTMRMINEAFKTSDIYGEKVRV